jgi:hypothetical protein
MLLCQVFQLGQCGQCLQRLAEANAKSTGPYYDSRYNRDPETLLSGFSLIKKEKFSSYRRIFRRDRLQSHI